MYHHGSTWGSIVEIKSKSIHRLFIKKVYEYIRITLVNFR